jgi:large subunit ribosomal protein L21
VLLYSDGSTVNVGTPTLEGAQVKATVVAQVKAPKVLVFKYRPKLRYRVKRGHRQHYTRLKVDSIELAKARKPRAKKSESRAEEVAEESPKE